MLAHAGTPVYATQRCKGDGMCHRVTCRKCGKATWSGCGQHADEVMRGVPKEQRCAGHDGEPSTSLLSRLFRR